MKQELLKLNQLQGRIYMEDAKKNFNKIKQNKQEINKLRKNLNKINELENKIDKLEKILSEKGG